MTKKIGKVDIMTNGELIKFLKKFPEDIPVYVGVKFIDDAIVTHYTADDLVEEAIVFEHAGMSEKVFSEC